MRHVVRGSTGVTIGILCAALGTSAGADLTDPPDLTKGEPPDERSLMHDTFNLGPTGAQGWVFGKDHRSTLSRQILITQVDPSSPADKILMPGDIIVGLNGKVFTSDARKAYGRAITEAEKVENRGVLHLVLWRKGEQENVTLTLKVMGTYSETSPWDCPKTKSILLAGRARIRNRLPKDSESVYKLTSTPIIMNLLTLLASDDPDDVAAVQVPARAVADHYLGVHMVTNAGKVGGWDGIVNLLLTEYYLKTGDEHVLPGMRDLSVYLAMGQSSAGTCGHGLVPAHEETGQLHNAMGGSYGPINMAAIYSMLSFVLARKGGVTHPEVRDALTKHNYAFRYYVGKGAIPYGDHGPRPQFHDYAGRGSIAGIAYGIEGRHVEEAYFARCAVASHEERERYEHTGNYFSILNGPLGANRAGPAATAAFMKELRWYFDLARRWDGGFDYLGEPGHRKAPGYRGWDCTGSYLLAYSLPHRGIYLTGRDMRDGDHDRHFLTGADLEQTVGPDSEERDLYKKRTEDTLLENLTSWSPTVRRRAAAAFEERTNTASRIVPMLISRLASDTYEVMDGACRALPSFKEAAAPAVPHLAKLLLYEDEAVTHSAADAIKGLGPAIAGSAIPTVADLIMTDDLDPLQRLNRRLVGCLSPPRGQKTTLPPAILVSVIPTMLRSPAASVREQAVVFAGSLDDKTVKPLLPLICKALKDPPITATMSCSGFLYSGRDLLRKHKVKDALFLNHYSNWREHAWTRTIGWVLSFGAHAKEIIPGLQDYLTYMNSGTKGREVREEGKRKIRETITLLEDMESPPDPEIRSLGIVTSHADIKAAWNGFITLDWSHVLAEEE